MDDPWWHCPTAAIETTRWWRCFKWNWVKIKIPSEIAGFGRVSNQVICQHHQTQGLSIKQTRSKSRTWGFGGNSGVDHGFWSFNSRFPFWSWSICFPHPSIICLPMDRKIHMAILWHWTSDLSNRQDLQRISGSTWGTACLARCKFSRSSWRQVGAVRVDYGLLQSFNSLKTPLGTKVEFLRTTSSEKSRGKEKTCWNDVKMAWFRGEWPE